MNGYMDKLPYEEVTSEIRTISRSSGDKDKTGIDKIRVGFLEHVEYWPRCYLKDASDVWARGGVF